MAIIPHNDAEFLRWAELHRPPRHDVTWWRTTAGGHIELVPPDELRERSQQEELQLARDSLEYFTQRYVCVSDGTGPAGPVGTITYTTANSSSGFNWGEIEQQPDNPPLQAEWLQHRRREQPNRIDWQQHQRDEQTALKKSKALLCSFLTAEQVRELTRDGKITIKSNNGQTYRISATPTYNVETGRGKYCAVPEHKLPIYDMMLTQMLVLQTNPDHFMQVANRDYLGLSNMWGMSIVNGITQDIEDANLPQIEWVT